MCIGGRTAGSGPGAGARGFDEVDGAEQQVFPSRTGRKPDPL
jgi:hypothetical protein